MLNNSAPLPSLVAGEQGDWSTVKSIWGGGEGEGELTSDQGFTKVLHGLMYSAEL